MLKYSITKSMNRKERCNLVYKLYSEMMSSNHFLMIFSTLEQELARKKKKRLYGNRKDNELNVVKLVRFKGILVHNIITKNKGIDIVFDSSPIDAPYVEFIRIAPSQLQLFILSTFWTDTMNAFAMIDLLIIRI